MSSFENRLKLEDELQRLYDAFSVCNEAILDLESNIMAIEDKKILLNGQKTTLVNNLQGLKESGPNSPIVPLFDKGFSPGRFLQIKEKIAEVDIELAACGIEIKEHKEALAQAKACQNILPEEIRKAEKKLGQYGDIIFIHQKVNND